MNKIYQNLPQKTENLDQKLTQNADTLQPDLSKKNKLKNIINKQKIVESKPNKIKNFETLAKIVLLSKKAQSRIEQEKIKALKALENRRKTISKFCFKETEKDEDPFLIPIMKKITQGENNGSMNVCELWSDKNMKKYLTFSNMTDGKFALRAIAKANQLTQQKQKQPYTFTNKEQNHFKGESDIYGDQARQRIRQEFEKQKDYINFYHQQNEQKNLLDNIKVDSNYIKHYYKSHYQIQNDQNQINPENCPICLKFLGQLDIYGNPSFMKQNKLENTVHKFAPKIMSKIIIDKQIQNTNLNTLQNEFNFQNQMKNSKNYLQPEKFQQDNIRHSQFQDIKLEQSKFSNFKSSRNSQKKFSLTPNDYTRYKKFNPNSARNLSIKDQCQAQNLNQSQNLKINKNYLNSLLNNSNPSNLNLQILNKNQSNKQLENQKLNQSSQIFYDKNTQNQKNPLKSNQKIKFLTENIEKTDQKKTDSIQGSDIQQDPKQIIKTQNNVINANPNKYNSPKIKNKLIQFKQNNSKIQINTEPNTGKDLPNEIHHTINTNKIQNIKPNQPFFQTQTQNFSPISQTKQHSIPLKSQLISPKNNQISKQNSQKQEEKKTKSPSNDEQSQNLIISSLQKHYYQKYEKIFDKKKNSKNNLFHNQTLPNLKYKKMRNLDLQKQINTQELASPIHYNSQNQSVRKYYNFKEIIEHPKRKALYDIKQQREQKIQNLDKSKKNIYFGLNNVMKDIEKVQKSSHKLKEEISVKIDRIESEIIKNDLKQKRQQHYIKQQLNQVEA